MKDSSWLTNVSLRNIPDMQRAVETRSLTPPGSTWKSPPAAMGMVRILDFQWLAGTGKKTHLFSTFTFLLPSWHQNYGSAILAVATWHHSESSCSHWKIESLWKQKSVCWNTARFCIQKQCSFTSSQQVLHIPSPSHLRIHLSSLPSLPGVRISSGPLQ